MPKNPLDTPLSNDASSTLVSRRTIAKGAAWAAPAIVVAGAAPAFASSPVLFLEYQGACKYPGNSDGDPLCKFGYRLTTTWTNTSTETLSTTFNITLNFDAQDIQYIIIDDVWYPYADNQTFTVTVPVTPGTHVIETVATNDNSGNLSGSLVGTASYEYRGNNYSVAVDRQFDATPPGCTSACPEAKG